MGMARGKQWLVVSWQQCPVVKHLYYKNFINKKFIYLFIITELSDQPWDDASFKSHFVIEKDIPIFCRGQGKTSLRTVCSHYVIH